MRCEFNGRPTDMSHITFDCPSRQMSVKLPFVLVNGQLGKQHTIQLGDWEICAYLFQYCYPNKRGITTSRFIVDGMRNNATEDMQPTRMQQNATRGTVRRA